MSQIKPAQQLPELLTVPEAAHALRICKGTVYNMVKRGHLPVVRVGNRFLVQRAASQSFVERGGQL